MNVTVNITKGDVVRINLYWMRRSRSTYVVVAVLALGLAVVSYFSERPGSQQDWIRLAITSIAGGLGGLLGAALFSMAWVLLSATEKAGITGRHDYEIKPDGFHERTERNEGVNKWNGMLKPWRTNRFILVRVNAYLFHVVPRRAFADQAHYEAFWTELSKRFESAA